MRPYRMPAIAFLLLGAGLVAGDVRADEKGAGQAGKVAREATTHLRSLGQAMFSHANDDRGFFPDHLADLLHMRNFPPAAELLVRPGTVIPPDIRQWPLDRLRKWVDDNGTYTYVAKGRKTTDNWGQADDGIGVVAYQTDPDDADGLAAALFRDGHVERLPMDRVKQLLP